MTVVRKTWVDKEYIYTIHEYIIQVIFLVLLVGGDDVGRCVM